MTRPRYSVVRPEFWKPSIAEKTFSSGHSLRAARAHAQALLESGEEPNVLIHKRLGAYSVAIVPIYDRRKRQ